MDIQDMLFLLIFLLLPLLEGVLRKKKPPEQRKPGQPKPEPPTRTKAEPRMRAGGERAERAEMPQADWQTQAEAPPPLTGERPWWEAPEEAEPARSSDVTVPDEVWEVLTGQRAPAPWEEAEEDTESLETFEAERASTAWERGLERQAEAREPVVHELPRVVSLEVEPPAPARRHAAFHSKLDETVPRVGVRRRSGVDLRLRGAAAMRRAVVLKEVLGSPRGLEEWTDPRG